LSTAETWSQALRLAEPEAEGFALPEDAAGGRRGEMRRQQQAIGIGQAFEHGAAARFGLRAVEIGGDA